jgi:hypothetical protein
MSKKIFIYSIERPSALGIDNWTSDTTGRKLRKSKIGYCTDSICALYSPRVGGLANYITYTPYIDPETGIAAKDEQGNTIMLQDYLEKKWNKPKGYYSNKAWRKGDSLDPTEMTFFQKFSFKLNDGSTMLDLNKEEDEIAYYVCLGSNIVANSEREWREHKWPKAQFYIALENESDEIRAKRNVTRTKALGALSYNPELTAVIKRKIASMLDLFSTKTVVTNEQVDNALYDYLDKSTFLPGSSIDKFNAIVKLFDTAPGREEFEARYLIKRAIDNRVIFEKQGTYTWIRPQGNIVIGDRYAEAIDFILNPKKTAEVEELQEQVNIKEQQ